MNYKIIISILKPIFIILFYFYIIVQSVILVFGPNYKEGNYTMVYTVYYPNNPKTYTINNNWPIDISSNRGTNYVQKTKKTPIFKNMFRVETVFSTSAPIEVVKYTFENKK